MDRPPNREIQVRFQRIETEAYHKMISRTTLWEHEHIRNACLWERNERDFLGVAKLRLFINAWIAQTSVIGGWSYRNIFPVHSYTVHGSKIALSDNKQSMLQSRMPQWFNLVITPSSSFESTLKYWIHILIRDPGWKTLTYMYIITWCSKLCLILSFSKTEFLFDS